MGFYSGAVLLMNENVDVLVGTSLWNVIRAKPVPIKLSLYQQWATYLVSYKVTTTFSDRDFAVPLRTTPRSCAIRSMLIRYQPSLRGR